MEKQEIFDTVVKHLFKQGERAVNSTGACRYRTYKGTMCAVGVLITDEYYKPSMDDQTLGARDLIRIYTLPKWFKENEELLNSLQSAHDAPEYWKSTRDMRDKLTQVAGWYELSTLVIPFYSFEDR